ncbi:MAG: hypothetical protein JRG85_13580 [Deltaproteobacteria bacterium]|nr:hypothetical protein [Deltaproteobacteria bacterium]
MAARTIPNPLERIDLLILGLLFAAAGTASWIAADRVHTLGPPAANQWFQADVPRVYGNMTQRESNHYRTGVHPLFSIATYPPVSALRRAGLDEERAVRALIAGAAGLWLAILYGVLRAFGLRRPDATLFAAVGAVSASALFGSAVPETHLFGSITLLLVMGFAACAATREFSPRWFVGFSAVSLSMAVTNWTAGLAVTALNHPWRRSVRISLGAFAAVTVVWALQNAIFPSSQFFLFAFGERRYVLLEGAGGIGSRLTAFFFHPMVMPLVQVLENPLQPEWSIFSVQHAAIGSSGLLGAVLSLIWIWLLAVGVRTFVGRGALDKPRIVLGLTLLGQLALHLVYGDETFLLSLHWLPLLVMVAGIGTLGPQRRTALIAGTLLAIGACVNNVDQFVRVTSELHR